MSASGCTGPLPAPPMLISSIVLGIAAGLAFRGRWRRLGGLEIRWWPVLATAVALRLLGSVLGSAAPILYVAAFAGIAAVAYVNRAVPGMLFVAAGSALNVMVVAANGGMPVDAGAVQAAGASIAPANGLHVPLDTGTRLAALADIIPIPLFGVVYSIGDVLLALGGFWVPFSWLRRP